jgi:hypothetical protein
MSHLSDERMSDFKFSTFFFVLFFYANAVRHSCKTHEPEKPPVKTRLSPCYEHWNVMFLTYMQNQGMRPRRSGSCALLL